MSSLYRVQMQRTQNLVSDPHLLFPPTISNCSLCIYTFVWQTVFSLHGTHNKQPTLLPWHTYSHYSLLRIPLLSPSYCQDYNSSAQEPLYVIKWLQCLESVLLHLALSNNHLFCFLCYLSFLSSKLNHKLFTECPQAPANPGRKSYFQYLKKPKRNYIFIYN